MQTNFSQLFSSYHNTRKEKGKYTSIGFRVPPDTCLNAIGSNRTAKLGLDLAYKSFNKCPVGTRQSVWLNVRSFSMFTQPLYQIEFLSLSMRLIPTLILWILDCTHIWFFTYFCSSRGCPVYLFVIFVCDFFGNVRCTYTWNVFDQYIYIYR